MITIADVPKKYQDSITINRINVRLISQRTGFGYRRYFLCPSCGRKCGKLHAYKDQLNCQICTPHDLYGYRQNLYDEGGERLISWHMERLARKIGIKIIYSPRERIASKKAGEHVLDFPFDFLDYYDKPPRGMSRARYIKALLKLQAMERLRFNAIFFGCRYTVKDIKELSQEL